MAHVIISIRDEDDSLMVQASSDTPIEPDREFLTTAELVATFMSQNMGAIVSAAIEWSRRDEDDGIADEAAADLSRRLILPGGNA